MIAFKVVTPKGEYLKQEVKSIHVKTVVGETTILPNHMPIFASLVPCKLVLKNENDEEEIFAISGGFLQFNKNEGMILAAAIEGKKDIDLERAKKSMERAKARLEEKIQKKKKKEPSYHWKEQLIEFMYMASNPRHFLLLNFSKLVASVLKMSIIVFSS